MVHPCLLSQTSHSLTYLQLVSHLVFPLTAGKIETVDCLMELALECSLENWSWSLCITLRILMSDVSGALNGCKYMLRLPPPLMCRRFHLNAMEYRNKQTRHWAILMSSRDRRSWTRFCPAQGRVSSPIHPSATLSLQRSLLDTARHRQALVQPAIRSPNRLVQLVAS